MRSAIYTGTLLHARRTPARNVFRYPVSYWLVDLDELPELERRLRLVSVNRPNVVSFRDADHFEEQDLGPVRFVPLIGREGWDETEARRA